MKSSPSSCGLMSYEHSLNSVMNWSVLYLGHESE
uniref:Uncharacterized protein n=1 Tax=Anguilla anguilla TaxID=7936 RepID=A0A0E9U8H8_ANGAN